MPTDSGRSVVWNFTTSKENEREQRSVVEITQVNKDVEGSRDRGTGEQYKIQIAIQIAAKGGNCGEGVEYLRS